MYIHEFTTLNASGAPTVSGVCESPAAPTVCANAIKTLQSCRVKYRSGSKGFCRVQKCMYSKRKCYIESGPLTEAKTPSVVLSIVGGTSLTGDSKLSAALPQLSLLMQLRLVHVLPSDLAKRMSWNRSAEDPGK